MRSCRFDGKIEILSVKGRTLKAILELGRLNEERLLYLDIFLLTMCFPIDISVRSCQTLLFCVLIHTRVHLLSTIGNLRTGR